MLEGQSKKFSTTDLKEISMTPTDKKILRQALASLPSARKASLESVLLEDSDPVSEDQNLPESYYGLPPKGVQARRNHKAEWDPSWVAKQALVFGRSLAGQPPLAIALKDTLKKLGHHEIGKALLKGYMEGQRAMDEEYALQYNEESYYMPDIPY